MNFVFQSLGQLSPRYGGGSVSLQVADPGIPLVDYDAGTLDIASVWRSQPAVRKVVGFIASNVASIPLHVYARRGETDRVRVRDGALAGIIGSPSKAPGMSPIRFWERSLIDQLIYDRMALMIVDDGEETELVRIPPRRFHISSDGLDRVKAVRLLTDNGDCVDMDPAGFILDVGYSQTHGRGTSPIQTLRPLLEEAAESVEYRRAIMRKAAQHTGWVERTDRWASAEARANFLEGLRAFEAHAARAGGTLLLDEGMQWHDRSFKPTDQVEDLAARKLTDIEVASAYHIPPELLGIREGNFSNLEAMRQALYRDHLGPYIDAWVQSLRPLVTRFGGDGEYVEAHVDAKLRGSFEEAARILQTSTGAPWLTRNEARARANLPAIDGGDELVTPLNVLIGGQASPTDSGSQNVRSAVRAAGVVEIKSIGAADEWQDATKQLFFTFFSRQGRAVASAVGPKARWWDKDRWDRELAADLHDLAMRIVAQTGSDTVRALGFDPDTAWSTERCRAYLKAVTRARAEWVNEATRRRVEAALEADDAVTSVFEQAKAQRATAAARAFTAAISAWAVIEAGKQAAPGHTMKTWVTGRNPRPEHAAMNGITVPANTLFPNGMTWPGDPSGGADQVAGCNCSITLTYQP